MSSMASTSEQDSIIVQMEKMMTMMKDLSDRLQNIENQRLSVENEGVQNHEGGNQEERRGREITRYNSLPRMLPRRFVEERVDNNLSSLRMEMPTFNGDDEPEVFLNWVDEVENIFGLHNFGEEKKFKTAIASLKDFAKLWWKQLSRRRLEDQDEPIETWGELKREMRRTFVPSNFYRDMRRKLQELKQGSKSVREFYKEMERLKARANIQEDDETTIARILEGFNRDIRRELRNQEFDDVDKLVRVASKVEDELRSERGSKPSVSSQWDQPRRSTNNSYQSRTLKEYSRPSHTQEEKKNNQREKEKFQEGSKQKVSNVTCYRCQGRGHYARECPNTKKILTTGKDEREYMSANESDDEELEPNGERQKDDHSEEEFRFGEQRCLMLVVTAGAHKDLVMRDMRRIEVETVVGWVFFISLKDSVKSELCYNLEMKRMHMNWRDGKNKVDCGVYLMRHMKSYTGEGVVAWDCGFVKGDQAALDRLC
nr:putative retrotransposon polyprotein [Ipomoea batatas]